MTVEVNESSSATRLDGMLEQERRELARSGSLHWFHWLIVVSSALLTLAAWNFLTKQIEERNEARFQREPDRAIELVAERMRK